MLEHRDAVVTGPVVDNDDFVMRVLLGEDALDGLFQVFFRVVTGRHDGNQRGLHQVASSRGGRFNAHCCTSNVLDDVGVMENPPCAVRAGKLGSYWRAYRSVPCIDNFT
ncbi:hypothetical protein D3C85_1563090 [compost metagenome]